MDVWEARAVLEVGDADGWDAVRASYRRLIRLAHPDLTGEHRTAPTSRRAARLNEAYAVLSRAKRAGTLDVARPVPGGRGAAPPKAPPPPPPAPPPPPRVGVARTGTDTLLLAVPPQVAFPLLVDAAHRVGSLGYVDRSSAVFELIVHIDGETCSVLVMVQPRDHGTEAVFAVESLERVASHSPEPILRQVVAALG